MVYSLELCRHVIAFAAVFDGLTSHHFAQYFMALFLAYDVKFSKNDFLGVIMDFSDAQRAGFLKAYESRTGRSDGLKYIKGCTVHFSRSVDKLSKVCQGQNSGVDGVQWIKKATHALRTATTKDDYKRLKRDKEDVSYCEGLAGVVEQTGSSKHDLRIQDQNEPVVVATPNTLNRRSRILP